MSQRLTDTPRPAGAARVTVHAADDQSRAFVVLLQLFLSRSTAVRDDASMRAKITTLAPPRSEAARSYKHLK